MFGLLVTLAFTASGVFPLKLHGVSVPAVVIHGESVRLSCHFDLGIGEKLYSVRWHKDNVEFFRFLPDNQPPGYKYDLIGTRNLEVNASNQSSVFMSRTDVHSEGMYRCEVSTDAPLFQTVKGEGEMRIYVFPSEKPQITGNKPSYAVGDNVSVICHSAPSRPATFLRWFINSQEAPVDFLVRYDPKETIDGLVVSKLGLRFAVKNVHFLDEDATMTLHCEAIISQAHTLTSEEILISQNASSTADRTFDRIRFESTSDTTLDRTPRIIGSRVSYRAGDIVHINCTAPRSQPPAELHWYMNDKEVRPEYLVRHPPNMYADGQESSVLGLHFEVKQRYFPNGQPMRLRCTAAALSEVTRVSSSKVQAVNRNQRQQVSGLHVYEKSLAVSNRCSEKQVAAYSIWILLASALMAARFAF